MSLTMQSKTPAARICASIAGSGYPEAVTEMGKHVFDLGIQLEVVGESVGLLLEDRISHEPSLALARPGRASTTAEVTVDDVHPARESDTITPLAKHPGRHRHQVTVG